VNTRAIGATANYNALQVEAKRRFTGGLTFDSTYTWSKNLADNQGPQTNGGFCAENACNRSADFFNRHSEYGNTFGPRTQNWTTTVIYELPLGHGKRFASSASGLVNAIIGGWRVSSILTFGSGFPIGVGTGTNRSNAGGDRPDAVPGQIVSLSEPATGEWFNIQAFALNQLYHWGNVGRNMITGPGINTWDFSTLKDFHFTERRYVQFRFEGFNFANHPNFGDPNASLTSDAVNSAGVAIPGTGVFGTINSLRAGIDMRELQFSLKLVF